MAFNTLVVLKKLSTKNNSV